CVPFRIDMYVEGMFDLNELLMTYVVQPADKKEQHYANMMDKTENRYLPVFEKVLKDHGKDFLVGKGFCRLAKGVPGYCLTPSDIRVLQASPGTHSLSPTSCLWIPALSAGANGRDRWNEDGADQSHCQLHLNEVQPLREGPEGESPSFKARISNIPTIKKFLQPGSQRKPLIREEDVPKVIKIFY
ncbi:glutathione S-transferase-like, partial [Malurus melanocephalus]|uniref:glutathione S-transferase-like n=1 Tax=Malurus melanocephalus TaxID=175006 RepID=UPI0025477352